MIKQQKEFADDLRRLRLDIEEITRDQQEEKEKLKAVEEKLKEMGDRLEYVEDTAQVLAVWERKRSYELQDAREVMIRVSLLLVDFLICTPFSLKALFCYGLIIRKQLCLMNCELVVSLHSSICWA